MLRRRHRTGPYPIAETRNSLRGIVWIAGIIAALALMLWAGKALVSMLGIGNAIERMAVILVPDHRGSVSVSLSGEKPRIADSDLKLYPEDSVTTDRAAPATLAFFDGTALRLDRSGSLTIEESVLGVKESTIVLLLERGTAWVSTPDAESYSGAIMRTVRTLRYTADIPSGAEAVFSPDLIEVYGADGVGVTFALEGVREALIVGEGQRFTVPLNEALNEDPYAHRSAMGTESPVRTFVLESRLLLGPHRATDMEGPTASETTDEIVTIDAPAEGTVVRTATLTVSGTFSAAVDAIRVNGYRASTNAEKRTYSLEIAVPDAENIVLTVEAIDRGGVVLGRAVRTLKRDRTPLQKPVIAAPAPDGAVYRSTAEELEIRGTAPRGTAGIIVNDYRLQLFTMGDTTWSYLASTRLHNFVPGENIFRIVAVSEAGYRSDPAVLTIILGGGEEGIVSGKSASAAGSAASASLPHNPPLMPGTLKVTAPTAGTGHRATLSGTGTEFLIEGTVPAGTRSIWVNDYQLQLYRPGKTFFNYIASTQLRTLKRGSNPYIIVARNKDGDILDRLEYTIILSRE